jgi:hypothetical protein
MPSPIRWRRVSRASHCALLPMCPAIATRPFQTSTDWSGDGSRLLFTRWSSERSRGGIGVVGLDGSNPHVVIPARISRRHGLPTDAGSPSSTAPDQHRDSRRRTKTTGFPDGGQRLLQSARLGTRPTAPRLHLREARTRDVETDGSRLHVLDATAQDTVSTWAPDGHDRLPRRAPERFGGFGSQLVFISAEGGVATAVGVSGATVASVVVRPLNGG